jgi:uncharacterized membrane protein YphA (DoxX/SURF4 family)/thiol-disulfide isomerase/thioredoxin
MSVLLLGGRLILSAVFAVAALSKLGDRVGLRESLSDFGLPRRLTAAGALVLPLAELAVAGLLIPPATARVGALAALGLLAVFCIAIGRALARGERPDCACFGQRHSAPVGRATLARNAALGGVAVLTAAAGPGRGLGAAVAGMDVTPVGVAIVVVILVLVLQGWFGWQLFRQNGRLIERVRTLEEAGADAGARSHKPAGLPVGEPAPAFELSDPHGRGRTLDDLLAPGRPLALVFSDPDCGACVELAPKLERLREAHAGSLEFALISRGGTAENVALLGGSSLEHVLLQHGREVVEAYRIHSVPSATIIDAQGRIASPTVTGDLAIVELLRSSAASAPMPERLRVAGG